MTFLRKAHATREDDATDGVPAALDEEQEPDLDQDLADENDMLDVHRAQGILNQPLPANYPQECRPHDKHLDGRVATKWVDPESIPTDAPIMAEGAGVIPTAMIKDMVIRRHHNAEVYGDKLFASQLRMYKKFWEILSERFDSAKSVSVIYLAIKSVHLIG